MSRKNNLSHAHILEASDHNQSEEIQESTIEEYKKLEANIDKVMEKIKKRMKNKK